MNSSIRVLVYWRAAPIEFTLVHNNSAAENAASLYHEIVHTQQPSNESLGKREFLAYLAEERFRIDAGLAPHDRSFRPVGSKQIDESAIRRYVEDNYPSIKTDSGDRVVGQTPSGESILQRADKTEYNRLARKGDSYVTSKPMREPPDGEVTDISTLVCR